MTFDAIALEVMWNRLITIAEEAENTLVRTSFSTVISEAHDFAFLILDGEARSIAQAPKTLPGFTLTLPTTVSHCIRKFPVEDLVPGDVLITNDPWQGTGHLSDVNLIRPVFHEARLVGLVAVVGHVSDIGGVIGYHSGRDVHEEGLRIPISKLYRRGEPDELLFSMIRANVRVPDLVVGDIIGMASALEVGHSRLCEFLDDTGLEDLTELSEALGKRANLVMGTAIASLPAGRYEGAYTFDGYETPLTLRAAVTIDGSTIDVDYAGTSPQQTLGAINAPFVIARAETLYFFQYMLTPPVPTCGALFEPITVKAPRGCLLNPEEPAAVKARSKSTFHIPEVLFNALAPAIPERVQAASGHSCFVIFNGQDRRGRPFNSFYLPGGGMGASSRRDGLDCTLFPTNTTVTPIEALENTAPVAVLEKRLLIDSAGPGRQRGGAGQRVVIRSLSDRALALTLRPEDKSCPPAGLAGGRSGSPCRIWLNGEPCSIDLLEFKPGDELAIELPGGGGFGDPLERSADAVRRDVESGLVSLAAAVEDYGVIIDLERNEVDELATTTTRAQLSKGGD